MHEKAESGGKFYNFPHGNENDWENAWIDFTHDIREITDKYEKKIKLSE